MKPLTTTTPHVIIMVGIPGAGKTTFAEHFAHTFQAPIVNQAALAQLAAIEEPVATRLASHILDELLKTHKTIVYEGPTHSKAVRQALVKRITTAGYEPLLLWVQTESVEAKRRATRTQKGKESLSESDFDKAIKQFSPPSVSEKPVVISGKHTYASQLKIVLKHLAGTRPDLPAEDRTRPGRSITIR